MTVIQKCNMYLNETHTGEWVNADVRATQFITHLEQKRYSTEMRKKASDRGRDTGI